MGVAHNHFIIILYSTYKSETRPYPNLEYWLYFLCIFDAINRGFSLQNQTPSYERNVIFSIQMSLKFVLCGSIDNQSVPCATDIDVY